MAQLVLSGVSCEYPGGVVGVAGLELSVADGELLVLVGPSGSGKTTTLRLIAGLEQPSRGEIWLGGRRLDGVAAHRRDVALVGQYAALYPHLSVRENLAFGLKLRSQPGWPRRAWRRLARPAEAVAADAQIAAAVGEVAMMLGLTEVLDRRPGGLSGGEQQRVALGRALARRPQAWLFDEPLAHLDRPLRDQLRRELVGLQQRLQATMVYVTHDTTEALALGGRVAVLRAGELQQVGAWRDVYDRATSRFVAEFIGPLPLGVVTGVLHASTDREHTIYQLKGSGWTIPVDNRGIQAVQQRFGKRLAMGIRPEDVHLGGEAPPWPTACQVEAAIRRIEPRGDCALVWLKGTGAGAAETGDDGLIARAEVNDNFRAGCHVRAWINLEKAQWFEADTGRRVGQ